MKRCLNCRKTYEDELAECPFCGYKPRTKNVTTKRFERSGKANVYSSSGAGKVKSTTMSGKNIYAASSHSGAFYIKSGERLNKRYSVINVMGFGVFGVAYECFDNFTKQHVVVKEYMPSYLVTRSSNGRDVEPISEDAEVKFSIGCDSFLDENQKLDVNNVECVPKLIECFRQNNTSYAVTELVGGEALSSVLTRKGKLSYETTAGIITSVLQGLRRLNRIGTIHGDICPENIIVVSENKTYLLDYNLSDFNKNMYTQRESGKPRPGYSALEMYYKDMEIGPWTDVYAAAAVMYKMLTGIVIPTAVKRSAGDTLTAVSKLGVPISTSAEKAMMKALKVDWEKRVQSPEDFLNGFVGDGFDNITAVKNKKKSSPSLPPQRSGAARPQKDGSGFLKGMLVVLTLTAIGIVIWFFISGVFPIPKAVTDFFGLNGSDHEISLFGSSDSDVSVSSTVSEASERESDESSSKSAESKGESSGGGMFDGLVSRVTSGIADGITSGINGIIDDYFSSSADEEDDGYYDDQGDDYNDDENEEDYEENYAPDNGDDTETENSSGNLGDYVDGTVGFVSNLIDEYIGGESSEE